MKTQSRFLALAVLFVAIFALLISIASEKAAYAANYCIPGSTCLLSGGVTPPNTAPAPGEAYTGMSSGVFEYSKTDLTIAAPIPIAVTRTYREFDRNANGLITGAFGIGTTLNYDIYLYSASEVSIGNYSSASVVLPDGGQILCTNTNTTSCTPSSCPFTSNTQFQCNKQPIGKWFNSLITWDPTVPGGGGWDLTLKDGTVFAFGAGAPLQSIKDRYNNSIALTRMGVGTDTQLGNITTITASNGRQIALNYAGSPANCCITSYTDPAGRAINYSYTSGPHLQAVTYPNIAQQGQPAVTNYTWNSDYPTELNKIAVTLNSVPDIDYIHIGHDDATARVTSIYPGTGAAPRLGVEYAYTTDGNGHITTATATFPDGTERRLWFNSAGYVTKDIRAYTDTNAQTFTYTRDSANRVTDFIDALGRDTHYVYDQDGNITAVTQLFGWSNAVTTSYQYDYTQYDQLSQVTNGLGKIWTIDNHVNGNPLVRSVTDPLGHTWTATYNSNGQVASLTDPATPDGSPLYNVYYYPTTFDLQSITDRALNATSYQYDAVGRPTQVASPLQEVTTTQYDDKDEVTSVTDPNGNTTSYVYNLNGNLHQLTDARGGTTTWDWAPPTDASNWNVQECDPGGRCAYYVVENAGGAIDQYVDKRGVVSAFTYDRFGNMKEAVYDRGHILAPATRTIDYLHDAANRVTDITDSIGYAPCAGSKSNDSESFSYDGLDDVKSTCTPEGFIFNNFDAIGRRQQMEVMGSGTLYQNQDLISYTWDDANEIQNEIQSLSGTTGMSASVTYTPDGQRKALTVNNVTSSYSYDPVLERLATISYASTQNPSLGSLSYSYDADGRITGKSGSFATVQLPAAEGPNTYWLTNQIETWGVVGVTPNAENDLVTDPSAAPGSISYAWDARNNLYKFTGPAGTDTYNYDAGGRRESVVSGGTTIPYLYDGTNPVGAGPVNIISLPGSNEILTLSGVVPIHDALGSTLATVNSSGALATQYTYDPFGNVSPGSAGYGTTFAMAGIELDPTGLYHAGARYYHPRLQRFLSPDPAGFGGGGANLFAYAGNGPVGLSDPSGLDDDGCPNGDCEGGGTNGFGVYDWQMVALGGLSGLQESLDENMDPSDLDTSDSDFDLSEFHFTSSPPTPNYTRSQEEHNFLATSKGIGVAVTGGSNFYSQGAATAPGALYSRRYSPTQTITASWSAQYLFNTTDGQYSIPPGLGVGVSFTIMNDFDEPEFTTTFGIGKYGLVSVGVIEGYNIFTGAPDFAGLVFTEGIGITFPPTAVSVQRPQ